MKRWSYVLVAGLVLTPAMAEGQRPSNNMHTRSADAYLAQAAKEAVLVDKQEFLRRALDAALTGTRSDPNNPRLWLLAGQAYAQLNDLAGADSTFTKAETLYPAYLEETETYRLNAWITAYNDGVTALQAGDVEGGIRSLEQADRMYRRRPEALVTLGSVYVQQGDFPRAEATFRRALDILRGPERGKLRADQAESWREDELQVSMRLANIYVEQQQYAQAEQVYRDLLAADPTNTSARANLAVVMARAGKTEEAAAAYRELLAAEDLGESTLFNIGVGLFRADDHARATEAFRRAAALNPVSHEVLYNLAQSLFARSGTLEAEKEGAPAARRQEIDAELLRVNEEMRVTAESLHALDPANRNVLMMLAQAQRSLGELATGAQGDNWRRQALASLEKHRALKFEVSDVTVVPGDTEVQVLGQVTNLTAAAGSPLAFRFMIVDREGTELAAEEVSVTAPAQGETVRFDARLPAPESAAGWKYTVR